MNKIVGFSKDTFIVLRPRVYKKISDLANNTEPVSILTFNTRNLRFEQHDAVFVQLNENPCCTLILENGAQYTCGIHQSFPVADEHRLCEAQFIENKKLYRENFKTIIVSSVSKRPKMQLYGIKFIDNSINIFSKNIILFDHKTRTELVAHAN